MQPTQPILMAVPNVSEGRDPAVVAAIGAAFAPAKLLDTHSDPDHGRSVFTLAGRQGELAAALVSGAREATERIDLATHSGDHPHVGAIDVVPVVYLDDQTRGPACAEALTAAGLIGDELGLPVLLYGALARGRERAEIRRGGPAELARRIRAREINPDFGPRALDPHRGAVLVAARPPLVAFNVDLATDDVELARRIAAELRESAPGGLPGVRAIGLRLPHRACAQVSTNVHDHTRASLAHIVERIAARAPIRAAEIVGLAPAAALEGFPAEVRLAHSGTIENALGSLPGHGPDEEEASA